MEQDPDHPVFDSVDNLIGHVDGMLEFVETVSHVGEDASHLSR